MACHGAFMFDVLPDDFATLRRQACTPSTVRRMLPRWCSPVAFLACALALTGSRGVAGIDDDPRPGDAQRQIAWVWDGTDVPVWSQGEAAVVVDHYLLQGDGVLHRPRATAPRMPAGTRVTPVVHVELSTVRPPHDVGRHEALLVQALLDAAARSTSGWVQLDMEARPSQREAFLQLVARTRQALRGRTKLSVTALAWWCRTAWVQQVQADEVVPMFYRMGRDAGQFKALLHDAPQQLAAACRTGAAGFAMQEPPAAPVARRYGRLYWFDLQPGRGSPLPLSSS